MTRRRDAAVVLAMVAWAKKRLAAIERDARLTAEVEYPGEKTAAVVDGQAVAYVSQVTRKPTEPFTYLNEAGFIDWVAQRWPSEIEARVRPAFLAILAEKAEAHDGNLIDDDGEVCPWVKVNDPITYTTTRLEKHAEALLAPLLGHRTLDTLTDYITNEGDSDDRTDGHHDD